MINQYAMGIKAFFFFLIIYFSFWHSAGHLPRKRFGSASQLHQLSATSHRLRLQNLIFDLFVAVFFFFFDDDSCGKLTGLNGAAVKKERKKESWD